MLKLEHLEWDSTCFGRKVGRIRLGSDTSVEPLAKLLGSASKEGYALIYLFHSPALHIASELMCEFRGRVVPSRIELVLDLDWPQVAEGPSIQSFSNQWDWRELRKLGRSSGHFSRFFVDPEIPKFHFEKMYDTWVERSVKREIADEVFVCRTGNEVIGFVTISIKAKVGMIGLLAVGIKWRGKGIARKLVSAAGEYAVQQGALKLRVVTQEENEPAMRLYTKCGFKTLHRERVKHFL